MFPIISAMLVIPIVGFVLIALLKERMSKGIAVASTAIVFALTLGLLIYSITTGNANLSESYSYISSFGIGLSFRLGIIPLILLFMSSIVLLATALSGNHENSRPRAANMLIMLFQIASIGLFTSANFFMFFIFWDIGVIAMFFMINVLGSANRRQASIKFLIYELLASALLLLAILMIYFYTPVHSFDIAYITSNIAMIPANVQGAIFALLFIAFMINMPLFPLHHWLPDAHTEASTQGSMLLSGILTKYGGFGMILLFGMMPVSHSWASYIALLAAFSTFYAVFLLMRQTDVKRIIAYSTIVEMGIVMFGITALNSLGTYGAVYAMLSHGLVVALMFLAVGSLKHLFGERDINILRGTVLNAKATTYTFLIGTLAMVGFPLSAGFIADILIFLGTLQSFGLLGLIPLGALILLGSYMYFVINRSMLATREHSRNVDYIGMQQRIGYAFLMFFIFLFGVLPFLLLNLVKL
ncbi:MAG: NADH-quinone oxidoreductase subunit M [Candidatus Micrarchaeota archaeon]|nr:NADH-quinone oxidoreductase subunit M [Candidatus Micrarchaeota archaeon]